MEENAIENSLIETKDHIGRVNHYLLKAAIELKNRGLVHDASKLVEPELSIFATYGPRLKNLTYGSEEYKKNLEEMNVALEHHYANNSHHPEHFVNGVEGMTLYDLIEMFCDWRAAVERHEDGDIMKSIEINEKRFNISPQISQIFKNTIKKDGY